MLVSLVSLLIPIVVSAVFVFIASSVIHMATPFHAGDFEKVPNEEGVMNALRPFGLTPGDYMMPKPGSMKEMGSPEFIAKLKAGPVAIFTVRPGDSSMTTSLVLWFLYSIVISVFAAYVTGVALGPGAEYLKVFQISGCVAFTGYAMALPQGSIWWGKSWAATLRSMFDGLVYGLLTAGTFGWLWPN